MEKKRTEGERIFDLFTYDLGDAEVYSPEQVDADIDAHPREVISYLLDFIEEMG